MWTCLAGFGLDAAVVYDDTADVIKGLLLDFYGTVVEEDDEVVASICARAAANSTGMVTPAQVGSAWWQALQAAMAAPVFRPQHTLAVDSLAAALAATGCTADPGALCEDQFRFWRTAPLRAGTRGFLQSNDLPVCVVSNIDRDDLEAAMRYHGLTFAAVVTSEDARAYKPSPRMFREGLAVLGLRADEVLHVGDSLTADVTGAQRLGISPVWVNRRQRPVPADVDPASVIVDLADLAALLRDWCWSTEQRSGGAVQGRTSLPRDAPAGRRRGGCAAPGRSRIAAMVKAPRRPANTATGYWP